MGTLIIILHLRLFNLGNIWKYLSPTDTDMEKVYIDNVEEAYKFYKSFDQLKVVEELKDSSSNSQNDKARNQLTSQYLCKK